MKQLQDNTFKFPVEILIEASRREKSTILLQVSKQEQSFSIPYPEKPGQLTLDPDVHLLFDGNIKEGK
jgi:hypothetical protein